MRDTPVLRVEIIYMKMQKSITTKWNQSLLQSATRAEFSVLNFPLEKKNYYIHSSSWDTVVASFYIYSCPYVHRAIKKRTDKAAIFLTKITDL